MSEYLDDLNIIINCQNKDEFPKLFSDFRNKHYSDKPILDAFLDVFCIIKPQVNNNVLSQFIFNFVENRILFTEKDSESFQLSYDLNYIISILEEHSVVTHEEILDILNKLIIHSDTEKWQYDKVFNNYVWSLQTDNDFISRMQKLLDNKEFNSLFYCTSSNISYQSSEPVNFIIISDKNNHEINISPKVHPEIWESWCKHSEIQQNFVRFTSPFSIDTNHIDGAGLFYLLASVDLTECFAEIRRCQSDFSLLNATLSLTLSIKFMHHGVYKVHFGMGADEKDDSGNPTGMSSWWMNTFNLYSEDIAEKKIVLSDDLDNWLYMGRNKFSPPYFKYKYLPLNYVLKNSNGIFFFVKQEPNTKIIEGTFDIFDVSLNWNKVI